MRQGVEFVSEAWKDKEAAEEGGLGVIVPALGGLVLAALLTVFAQVPIGDPSVGLPANDGRAGIETPEQIKKKFEAFN